MLALPAPDLLPALLLAAHLRCSVLVIFAQLLRQLVVKTLADLDDVLLSPRSVSGSACVWILGFRVTETRERIGWCCTQGHVLDLRWNAHALTNIENDLDGRVGVVGLD
jgi:hypothetical protein